jgi:hypothetical protein
MKKDYIISFACSTPRIGEKNRKSSSKICLKKTRTGRHGGCGRRRSFAGPGTSPPHPFAGPRREGVARGPASFSHPRDERSTTGSKLRGPGGCQIARTSPRTPSSMGTPAKEKAAPSRRLHNTERWRSPPCRSASIRARRRSSWFAPPKRGGRA